MDTQVFNTKMKGIIVVLGSPNSDKGELSEIAINRLDRAVDFFKINNNYKILCTGGFGKHFNTTSLPHAKYAADYLKQRGVPAEDILEYVISSNTIEDALKTKHIIQNYNFKNLVVITSDFHIERARILFNRYLQDENLIFIEAISTLDERSLKKLIQHEASALKKFTGINE
jgi:uncharacterized SAM-binding protein YcdF (DUF218 family)